MKVKTYREQLHEELLQDTREFCCYCMTERHGLSCCSENHYVTYKDMYEDDQKEMLEAELEEFAEWSRKQGLK